MKPDVCEEAAELASALACNRGGINPCDYYSEEAVEFFWNTVDRVVTDRKITKVLSIDECIELWAEVSSILLNGD